MGKFLLIWLGQVVSFLGSGLTSFALGVQVFLNTGSVTRFALISLAMVIPLLVMSPMAGALADRMDRRRLLMISNIGSAVFTLLLFFLIRGGGEPQDWVVYLIVAANSAFNAFIWPTLSAATTLLVDKVHFARASGLVQMGASMSRALSPAIAGLLLVSIGLRGVLLVDFATFLFAAVTLLMVRIPSPQATTAGAQKKPGVSGGMGMAWAFIRDRKGLLQLLWLFAAVNFCIGVLPVLLTPLVLGFSTPVVLGMVMTFATFGMVVGGSVMTVWGGNPQRRVPTILVVLLMQALLLLLGGLRPSVTLVAVVAFLFQAGFPLLLGSTQAIWQAKTPPEIQGRVFALRRMIVGAMVPVAMAIAGPLADYVFEPLLMPGGALVQTIGGLIGTGPGRGTGLLFMTLGLIMLVAVLWAWRSRPLRRLESELPDVVGSSVPEPAANLRGEIPPALRLRSVPALALLLLLVAIGGGVVWLAQRVPSPLPASAPAAQFSAERAMEHVQRLASLPRPPGSPGHAAARRYLREQLLALGWQVEEQEQQQTSSQGTFHQVMTVHNVLARRPAGKTISAPAVMLMAHYDTVPESQGAADNASSVATLLETARALEAGVLDGEPAPARDIILAFTDLEESGLHGAAALLQDHPWARDVGVVLNFEARGHGGPVYMFQAGAAPGEWLPHYFAATPRPMGNSLLEAIYRVLPNDTDFTLFKDAGYAGFNFAFINGLTHYHSALDQPDDLSLGSLQHQGLYALSLTRHLASLDFEAGSQPDAPRSLPTTYFNLLGSLTVHYPRGVALGVGLLSLLLFVAVLIHGLLRRWLTTLGLLLGFLAYFGLLIGVPVIVTLLWFVVRDVLGVPVIMGSTLGAYQFMIAFAAFTAALVVVGYRFFRRAVRSLDLAAGALLWWFLITLMVILTVPSGSYLFSWPLLGASVGLAWASRGMRGGDTKEAKETESGNGLVPLLLSALPALLLVAPFVALIYIGLQALSQLAGVALLVLVLLLGLLLPQLEATTALRRLPLAAFVLAFGLLAWAFITPPAHDVELGTVLYAADTDADETFWYGLDPVPGPWLQSLGLQPGATGPLERFLPLQLQRSVIRAEAPAVPVGEPQIEMLEARPADSSPGWTYRFRLRAPAGSAGRLIWFEPMTAVTSVRFGGGEPVALDATVGLPVVMRLPTPEQEDVIIETMTDEAVTLVVVEQLDGLPAVPGLEPRPERLISRRFLTLVRGDVTLVRRSFELLPSAVFEPNPEADTVEPEKGEES